jgi:hypothetical protein
VPVAKKASSGRSMGDIWKLSQPEDEDDEG